METIYHPQSTIYKNLSSNVMNRRTLFIFVLAFIALAARPAHAQQVAVRADTLYPMTGDGPITNGVVLVEGRTIEAVGPAAQVDVPDDYRTLEASVVTPGIVDARATVGFTGLRNVDAANDVRDPSGPIQPELRAFDAYNWRESLVEFVQNLGVTTVNTGHAPGALMSGQTMIVKTGQPLDEAIVDSTAMVAMTLGPSVGENYQSPGTRAKSMAMMRQTLLEAQRYREQRQNAESSGDDSERPARKLRMEVLADVLAGEVPALITAHRASEIQSALRLAEEFDFELVLSGASEAYLLTDEIEAAGVPVILHPTMIRPGGAAGHAAFTTANKLTEAGIPVAIQSGYEPYVPKTRVALFEAAVAAGQSELSRREALRTVTIDAARILGISAHVGSLEEGKHADLALFEGDPLQYTTQTCGVLIEGEVVSDECQ